ncbi:MAG: phosphotransferase family protein [Gammaproteobacteria bacterium]|nr:phosphotransferase family protein [Gammaproteobacteria bacterium]MCY4275024.1 phosphotransferase family protein [Gammaproteobacteria bacterium]
MRNFDHSRLKSLEAYLSTHIDSFSGPLEISKFPDGQSNPTYRMNTPQSKYVLRKKPDGNLLHSAHAIDREFRVMNALHGAGIPTPRCLHLCEDEEVIGTMFFIMEFVEGTIFWNPSLPELNNTDRSKIYDHMNQVLANIHTISPKSIGLADFGKPGNYFARQTDRWARQYEHSATESIEEMDCLIQWLKENLPADQGNDCIVHGDYRLDNLIFDSKKLEVLAVLDWELSTLGHPYADVAYQCMQLRLPDNNVLPGLGYVNRRDLGIPNELEYVEMYCRRRNLDGISDWNFYLAFSFFRFAAILQGVKKRALDGNASSNRALELTKLVRPLAVMGIKVSVKENNR